MIMTQEIQKKMHHDMLRIRMIEEAIAERYSDWEMRCPVHLCIGQEAIAVGVCANLRKADYVMSTHRAHGHYLAKGGNLKAMLAEIYGKATGCSKGKGGSQHLIDLDAGFLGSTPIVGSIIPIATGVAFGIYQKDEDKMAAVFFGEAATEEGVFSESLNFASLKKLPILFICENNHFSVYSPLSVRQPAERDNTAIAKAYGIYVDKGNGNDVEEIYNITKKAVEQIQKGRGPVYLEFETYRWREHCGPNFDNNIGYRTEEEYLEWRSRCPIESIENKLKKQGVLAESDINQMKAKIVSEVEEAFVFAKSSGFPDSKELYSDLYA